MIKKNYFRDYLNKLSDILIDYDDHNFLKIVNAINDIKKTKEKLF